MRMIFWRITHMIQKTLRESRRFLVVGGMSTVLNYGIFWLFLALGTNYVIAAVAGYLVGLFFGYYLNRSWTFTSVAERKTDEFALYVFLYLVSLAASISFLGILVGKFFMHPLVAHG